MAESDADDAAPHTWASGSDIYLWGCLQLNRLNTVVMTLLLVFGGILSGQAAEEFTIKELADLEARRDAAVDSAIKKHDQQVLAGSTPLSSLLAIAAAIEEENWDNAARYIDQRYLEEPASNEPGGELIRKLVILWRQQRILDISTVSNHPEGHLDDKLPKYRERIGIIKSRNGDVPVYLQLVPDEESGSIWKISTATINELPRLWEEFGYPEFVESLSQYLPEFRFLNMANWQVVGLMLIALASWLITALLRWILLRLIAFSEKYRDTMQRFIRVPLRMFLFFTLVQIGVSKMGLSLEARAWLESGLLSYAATIFLAMGIIEFGYASYLSRATKRLQHAGILKPLATALKIVMVLLIILSWLDDAGYDIATILAGLGIGSLAVALAAQKTLENVLGAFTLYLARPIKAGDFCKFGDINGTIEEIGLRSTRIRKLNRSVVFVPNSVFASNSVENFTEIDRRHYKKALRVRFDTTPDQMRMLLMELRKLLIAHPRVLADGMRVRFTDIEHDALVIEVMGYINTASLPEYLAIAEDLNLRVMEILREQGVEPPLPEQLIHLDRAAAANTAPAADAQRALDALRGQGELPFPDFTPDEIERLRDSLDYPPSGRS